MLAIIGIILADVIVILLFVYHYRQELGLAVQGSGDKPIVRRKPAENKAVRDGAAEGQAKGSQVVPSGGAAERRAVRRGPRNA